MVGLRLFLPESWISDPERLAKAKVPADRRVALTKPEIAIEEIDRIRTAGLRFGCVLADAGYGMSAPFRQALSERGLSWAVGIPGRQKVYPADVVMIFPVAGHGRPRQHHIPDSKSLAAEKLLAGQPWRRVSWRRETKGRLTARFAALRVRVADGATQRIRDMPVLSFAEGATSICRARRSGWSASIARPASANTTSRTCLPTRRSRRSPAP